MPICPNYKSMPESMPEPMPEPMTGSMTDGDPLALIEEQLNSQKLPPVAQWHPERTSSMDMTIRRDGTWWYQGSRIQRERMVRLFSTVLRLEPDGQYALVTPAEKLLITVEDAPFVATSVDIFGDTPDTTVTFETNVGDRVIVDTDRQLYMLYDDAGNPAPYVIVRDGLPALLARSVYYQLAESCVEYQHLLGIWSRGIFHAFAESPDESTGCTTSR